MRGRPSTRRTDEISVGDPLYVIQGRQMPRLYYLHGLSGVLLRDSRMICVNHNRT